MREKVGICKAYFHWILHIAICFTDLDKQKFSA